MDYTLLAGAYIAWLLLVMVMVIAGLSKLTGQRMFGRTLLALGLTPWMTRALTPIIPLLEVATGVALFARPDSYWAQGALLMLLSGFTWAAIRAWRVKDPVPCSCFGPLMAEKLGATTGARIVLLLALDVYLVYEAEKISIRAVSGLDIAAGLMTSMGLIMAYPVAAMAARIMQRSTGVR